MSDDEIIRIYDEAGLWAELDSICFEDWLAAVMYYESAFFMEIEDVPQEIMDASIEDLEV